MKLYPFRTETFLFYTCETENGKMYYFTMSSIALYMMKYYRAIYVLDLV